MLRRWFAPTDIEAELDAAATPQRFRETGAYDRLPLPVKSVVSPEEYLWLTEAEKASLERDLCTPEW